MEQGDGAQTGRLLRVLGLTFGLAICVGSVIGGGILRTPGAVADRVPDQWLILLLWLLGGLHALLGANVVAELCTSVPKAGGLYVPTRRAFGDFPGMLVGWSDWLVNTASSAALALVFAEFAALISPTVMPHQAALAVCVLILLFGLNWIGVREGSYFQNATSLAKCVLLAFLVGAVFLVVPAATAEPAGTAAEGFTILGAVVAYQLVYGVFGGWAFPIFFVEEDENALRNVPKAMFVSIVVITVFYLLINSALLHALPIAELRNAGLPAASAMTKIFGDVGTPVVAALALVVVISCLNANIMVAPRILYGLGRDGLFLPIASRVNNGGTPDIGLAMSAAVALLLTLTGTYETVFLLAAALLIFLMLTAELSLFALRKREPDLPRPYRARGYPLLPALLILIDSALLVAVAVADPMSSFYAVALIGLSLPIYFWLRRDGRLVDRPT